MSNRRNRPRVFAWHIGNQALRDLGQRARELQRKRREAAAEHREKGERVPRGYSATRAEREARKSKVWR